MRLLRYKGVDGWEEFNKPLVTVRQYEEQRTGSFNLRQGETKYLPLIERFPEGYRFVTETVPSSVVDLDSACTAEVTLYGCGPPVTAIFGIEKGTDGRLLFWRQDE